MPDRVEPTATHATSASAAATLVCPACGYDVYQTIADGFGRCPECGGQVTLGICTDGRLLKQDRRSARFILALMAWPVLGTFGVALAIYAIHPALWVAWPALVVAPTWLALACVLFRHSSYEQKAGDAGAARNRAGQPASPITPLIVMLERWRSKAWRAAGSAGLAALALTVWLVTAGALGVLLAWVVVVMIG